MSLSEASSDSEPPPCFVMVRLVWWPVLLQREETASHGLVAKVNHGFTCAAHRYERTRSPPPSRTTCAEATKTGSQQLGSFHVAKWTCAQSHHNTCKVIQQLESKWLLCSEQERESTSPTDAATLHSTDTLTGSCVMESSSTACITKHEERKNPKANAHGSENAFCNRWLDRKCVSFGMCLASLFPANANIGMSAATNANLIVDNRNDVASVAPHASLNCPRAVGLVPASRPLLHYCRVDQSTNSKKSHVCHRVLATPIMLVSSRSSHAPTPLSIRQANCLRPPTPSSPCLHPWLYYKHGDDCPMSYP